MRYARSLGVLRKRARGIATAREYLALEICSDDETPARDIRIPFGQHKGKRLGSLPPGYLRVLARMAKSKWASLAEQVLDELGGGEGATARKKSFNWIMEQEAYLRLLRNSTSLEAVKLVHSRISESEHQHNVSLLNMVMESYGRLGAVGEAELVFDNMLYQDENSWTVIIAAFARNGQLGKARAAFDSAPARDHETWRILLESYADGFFWDDAISVFEKMAMWDVDSSTQMMNVYVQSGRTSGGGTKALFDSMPERDISAYSSMLQAFVQDGVVEKAKQTLARMPEWDVIAVNCMLGAYVDHGSVLEAKRLFDEFPERDETSMVLMIRALGLSGEAEEAKCLFDRVFRKDEELWILLLRAYSLAGNTEESKRVFDQIPEKTGSSWSFLIESYSHNFQLEDAEIVFDQAPQWSLRCWIALISAYSRCGDEQMARLMFNRISAWDSSVWNAFIAELVSMGRGAVAVSLLEEMCLQGFSPDEQTFINLLAACTAFRKPEQQSRRVFISMISDFGLTPWIQHFCSLLRPLGRAHKIEQARELVKQMPFEPDYSTWRALFDACRYKKDLKRGLQSGREMLRVDPFNPWTYSLVEEFCGVEGRQDKLSLVKELKKHLRKLPGDRQQERCSSWVLVKGRLHRFGAGHAGHLESVEIGRHLRELIEGIEKVGYVVNTGVVVEESDLSEEEKREIVCEHGEKLASAYGLMNSSRSDPVRMISDWRVCDDCHVALKLISKTTSRRIVLRDDRWFHHFEKGQCSCRDYW